MTTFENAANATLRIECGPSRGSGFQFVIPTIIVTNNHVVEGFKAPVEAVTEDGVRIPLKLLAASSTDQQDFAIFEAQSKISTVRHVLRPKIARPFQRGLEVIFSGFPHGIPHLLVQRAIVAGLVSDQAFYLDGSVNGGNSGGPIIDLSDGSVVGIVTQRRFLGGPDLAKLRREAEQVRAHCQGMAGRGSVQIMGIDFGGFSQLIADSMLLMRDVLEANANSGIGIGFSIEYVAGKCSELGIK
jgi:hypothetical protein